MKIIERLECGHPESPHSDFTRGYGTNDKGERHCYACCAERDKKQMREAGKIALYLTTKQDTGGNYGDAKITNWPGSLEFKGRYHKGRHNIAGSRYDVWFTFEGTNWHGVTYGDNTQICHCKRTKN
jgi:hypothetical protein